MSLFERFGRRASHNWSADIEIILKGISNHRTSILVAKVGPLTHAARRPISLTAICLIVCALFPQISTAQTLSVGQTLEMNLNPAAQLVSTPDLAAMPPSSAFGTFITNLVITSRVRTTPSGSGEIVMQFISDFTGTTGPKIANGELSFLCAGASYGTTCSGTIVASLGGSTTVNSFPSSACTGGGGACSALDPNSLTVQLSVPDKPSYKTGTYSVGATFSISAL